MKISSSPGPLFPPGLYPTQFFKQLSEQAKGCSPEAQGCGPAGKAQEWLMRQTLQALVTAREAWQRQGGFLHIPCSLPGVLVQGSSTAVQNDHAQYVLPMPGMKPFPKRHPRQGCSGTGPMPQVLVSQTVLCNRNLQGWERARQSTDGFRSFR